MSDNTTQSTTPIIQLGKDEQLLSVKELAWHLNRHPNYVYLMRKAGFPMPGNRTTLQLALESPPNHLNPPFKIHNSIKSHPETSRDLSP